MATSPFSGVASAILSAIMGVADIADPALAVPIASIGNLLLGLVQAEPDAMALISDFKSATPATQADLDASILAYHTTDDALAAALKADGAA